MPTGKPIDSQTVRQSDRQTDRRTDNRRMDSHINSQSDDETCWVIHLHAEGRRQRYQLWRIYELCLAKSPDKQRAEKAASLVTSYLQLACREASDDSQSIVNMLTNLSQQMSRLDCRKATGHRRKSKHVRLKYCWRSGSSIANTTLYYTIQCVLYMQQCTIQKQQLRQSMTQK